MNEQPERMGAVTAASARAHRAAAVVIVAAAALAVVLGVAKQPADPARDLSASIGVLDEGIWSHNAANHALFGRARLDEFNPMYVSAGAPLYRISYALFGVGIAETRLPSIALAAFTVVVVGALWWRRDALAGAAASVLLATTYLYLAYSRLGLLETPAAASAAGGLLCLAIAMDRRRNGIWAAIAGMLLALAPAMKPQAAAPVAGVLAGAVLWQTSFRRAGGWRALAFMAGGFVAVLAAWGAFVISHLDDALQSQWSWHASGVGPTIGEVPSNIGAFIRNSDGFGTHARPLLIAAAAGLVLQVAAWATGRLRPTFAALAGIGWACGAVLIVASLPYTPSRYAVLSLPGLALTAAGGIPAVRSLLPSRAWRVAAPLALAGVVAAAGIGVGAWLDWSRNAQYSLRSTARVLAETTRPGDVIMGGWGLLPSVLAKRQSIVRHDPDINQRCPIERFGVDWVIVNTREKNDLAYYASTYPGLIRQANMVATARVIGRPLELYRVPPGTRSPGCPAGPVTRS